MVTSRFVGAHDDSRSAHGIAYVWQLNWGDGPAAETLFLARDPEGSQSWLMENEAQAAALIIARSVSRPDELSPFYWVSGKRVAKDDRSQDFGNEREFGVNDRVMVQGSQPGIVERTDEYSDGKTVLHVRLDATPRLGTRPFVSSDLELIEKWRTETDVS
jgi:hypothetical protein